MSGLQSHSSRTSWLIMDGVIGKVEQDSLPDQQTRKIDAPIICAFVFFYPPINPFFCCYLAPLSY
ncbi:hypothetical protein D9J21_20370 [Escherichia coli]|nr:hypothetical protein [Escherichia coli]MMK25937.1 hypothetical protein [Escherichia coli]